MECVVLFVDDEPNIIRGIMRAFRSGRSRWKVLPASSGKEALEILAETEVDVIVTDMLMPHMNGKELLEVVIRSLVYYMKLIACWDKAKRDYGFGSPEEFWRHSVSVSSLAKRIAMLEQAEPCLVNDAFVSGLLHDLGKLIIYEIPQYRQALQAYPAEKCGLSYREEYALADTSHAEAGGYLLGLWALPQSVIDAVAFHHRPTGLGEASFSALVATYLANSIVSHQHMLAQGEEIDFLETMEHEYLSSIELKHELRYYRALAET